MKFGLLLMAFIVVDKYKIISFGDEIGSILSNLSLAYISSYMFYYIVVVVKEKRDKKHHIYTFFLA